jgi:molybdenum-dependent DNA-binding transcriptional regulator ModE
VPLGCYNRASSARPERCEVRQHQQLGSQWEESSGEGERGGKQGGEGQLEAKFSLSIQNIDKMQEKINWALGKLK